MNTPKPPRKTAPAPIAALFAAPLALPIFAALALLAIAALGCAPSAAPPASGGGASPAQDAAAPPMPPAELELIKGPVSPDGLQAIFATPDLAVGEQRVAVVLISEDGLVRSPLASMTAFHYPDAAAPPRRGESAAAVFRPFPLGTRGLYSARFSFDQPGDWGLEISVLDENANPLKAELRFHVPENNIAPAIGDQAPPSDSKTIHTAPIEKLTTGTLRDTDLYQISIADAVKSGKPTVIVMASPAFCTNAVCGPQVDVLSELKNKHAARANFIHVDYYENPDEIQGDLTRARKSSVAEEWRLPSSEWSFIIDAQGVIHQRFEAFAPLDELEQSLLEILDAQG